MAVRIRLVVELDDPTGQRGEAEIKAYGDAVVASLLAREGPEVVTFDFKRAAIRAASVEVDDVDPCAGGCSDPAMHAEGGHDT